MDGLTIAASLTEIRSALLGEFVRTIHQPAANLFTLRTSGAQQARLLIDVGRASLQLTEREIPNPRTPSSFTMLLRKALRGARVADIRQHRLDRIVTFELRRGEGHERRDLSLVAELLGLHGNLLLIEDGTVRAAARTDRRNRIGEPYVEVEAQEKRDPVSVDIKLAESVLAASDREAALMRNVDGIGRVTAADILRRAVDPATLCAVSAELAAKARAPEPYWIPGEQRAVFYPLPGTGEPVESLHGALDRQAVASGVDPTRVVARRVERAGLQRNVGRHASAVAKLRAWLDEADRAAVLQREADLLMTYLKDVPRRASQINLPDPETGTDVPVSLDPSLTPIENAQKKYEKAKRMRRGRQRTEQRLAHVEALLAEAQKALQTFETAEDVCTPPPEARPAFDVATSKEPDAPVEPEAGSWVEQGASGPRRCEIEGFTILVGRNAGENDDLVRDAAPDDVWMHARGHAGSHVVVKRGGRREIPESVLRRAASLAAYYSKARGERRVDVTTTEAKHVRKPRRAAPGLVIVAKESTLTVEPRSVNEEEER